MQPQFRMITDVLRAELKSFATNVQKQEQINNVPQKQNLTTSKHQHKIPVPAPPHTSAAASRRVKPARHKVSAPPPRKPALTFSVEVEQHEELKEHKDIHDFAITIAATATVDELIVRTRGKMSNKGFSDEFVFQSSLILLSHDGGQTVILGSRKGKRGTFLRSTAVLDQCLQFPEGNSIFVTIGNPQELLATFREGIAFGKKK